ncbi:MAG: terminase small subunit [Mucilaginibacter sp.]
MKLKFNKAAELDALIDGYFNNIPDESSPPPGQETQIDGQKKKIAIAKAKKVTGTQEPTTIAGLALYLGFSSRQAFEAYELNGKFADRIKRARLRVMADYEKKLHVTSSTGAIFALKSMGWNDRPEKPFDEAVNTILKVEIVHTGPQLASSEKEVEL